MTQQFIRFLSKDSKEKEKGAVLLLMAAVFLSAFIFAGVGIDLSNLFRYNLSLQKAIDAGAVASAKIIALTPYSEKTDAANLNKMKEAAFSTISLNFFPSTSLLICNGPAQNGFKLECDIDLSNVQENEQVKITARLDIPLIFLNKIAGIDGKLTVTNTAKAEVQPSIVKMMLDTSGSMACDVSGDCSCVPACGASSKFEKLKSAVKEFVRAFNPNRDFLGISFFSLDALEVATFHKNPDPVKKAKGYGIFDPVQIDNVLKVNFTTSSTNQCAALYQGYLDTFGAVPEKRTPAYILFSDGAPSAGRFFFSDVKGALPVNNIYGGAFTNYDYLSWLIKLTDAAGNLVENPSELARAPIDATELSVFRFNWQYAYPPQPITPAKEFEPDYPPGITFNSNAPCSVVQAGTPQLAFSGCINSMEFYTPDGKRWPDLNAGAPFSNFLEMYYNCAIAMSDYIRYGSRGVLYAIGLGTASLNTATAYQIPNDVDKRKDIFFSRLANDPAYKLNSPRFPDDYEYYINPLPNPPPEYLTQGHYFPVDNAASLNDVFRELYKQIVRKIKVVQLVP